LCKESSIVECGLRFAEENIHQLSPHLVLVFGSYLPDAVDYGRVAFACRRCGAHLAFWTHDDPYELDAFYKIVPYADTVFSNDKTCLKYYDHPEVFHLPLAGDPTDHFRPVQPGKTFSFDLLFCGVAFPHRLQMLEDLQPLLARWRVLVIGEGWPDGFRGVRNFRVSNRRLADLYNVSLATLNVGRDFDLANRRFHAPASTPGPRTFEAALAGTVQLYFAASLEIEDYFRPGSEILLFDDPRQIPELLTELSENPGRASAIAKAAQQRALRDHTYGRRAEFIIQKCLWR
jgi:spore maturation protein CgeB